jgi:hypothetical protein
MIAGDKGGNSSTFRAGGSYTKVIYPQQLHNGRENLPFPPSRRHGQTFLVASAQPGQQLGQTILAGFRRLGQTGKARLADYPFTLWATLTTAGAIPIEYAVKRPS